MFIFFEFVINNVDNYFFSFVFYFLVLFVLVEVFIELHVFVFYSFFVVLFRWRKKKLRKEPLLLNEELKTNEESLYNKSFFCNILKSND